MGVKHRGLYFTDIYAPHLAAGGVSNAVCHLMAREGHPVLAYVDDFYGVHADFSVAMSNFSAFEALTETLGLKLATDKSAFPAKRMTWLGFMFDTDMMVITLPPRQAPR